MRDERERGSGAVEAVIVLPFFFTLVFAIIQGALWFQASNIAHAAASAAYEQARTINGSVVGGIGAGEVFVGRHPGTLTGATVSVDRTDASVTATVRGTAPAIVPFWTGPVVERSVTGPTERWVSAR